MRISDWSSDVCSSDLRIGHRAGLVDGADAASIAEGDLSVALTGRGREDDLRARRNHFTLSAYGNRNVAIRRSLRRANLRVDVIRRLSAVHRHAFIGVRRTHGTEIGRAHV